MKRTDINYRSPRKWIATTCAACLLLFTLSASAVQTKIIKFDAFPGAEESVPNGYSGLNWTNFAVVNGVTYDNSGYQSCVQSTNNVAFNNDELTAKILARKGRVFRLNSGFFTGAWNDGLQLQVRGFKNSVLVYDHTYVLNATNATFITFPKITVTEVDFTSSGGSQHAAFLPGSGEHFAVDNLSITTQ